MFRASHYAALEVICRNGVPTHLGVWGGTFFDGTSLVPNKFRVGVLVYSAHPLFTQASMRRFSFTDFGWIPNFLSTSPQAGASRKFAGIPGGQNHSSDLYL